MIKQIKANKLFNIQSGILNYLGGVSREKKLQHLNQLLEEGIQFTDGINIIIGENGSGKTTILNIIRYLTFCRGSFEPELELHDLNTRFDPEYNLQLYENIKMTADYNKFIFNLYQMSAEPTVSEEMAFKNQNSAMQFMDLKSKSRGQNLMGDLSQLIHVMFDTTDHKSVLELVHAFEKEASNKDVFVDIANKALQYYTDNMYDSNCHTIIMDEPDQGLDIGNIQQVYDIISYDKPDTQMIAVIHNPLLIYKLSKLDNVNFIEMSSGYLDKIKAFIET